MKTPLGLVKCIIKAILLDSIICLHVNSISKEKTFYRIEINREYTYRWMIGQEVVFRPLIAIQDDGSRIIKHKFLLRNLSTNLPAINAVYASMWTC